MKPYLTYGAFIAIGNAVITLVLYLAGFHTDPAKLQTGNYISGAAGLVIGISLLVIGIRAKRATVPDTKDFNYGLALGAGVMISLFAGLFGTAFQFIYQSFINPGFADVVIEAQTAKFQSTGMSSDQIDKATQFMRLMTKPAVQAAVGFFGGMILSVIISLITAAFLKRKAIEAPLT
jgi:hypothetical protein